VRCRTSKDSNLKKAPQPEKELNMRRLLLLAVATALVAAFALPVTALARNPHFVSASASGPNLRGVLVVRFRIVGLGSSVTTIVRTTADVSAVYACRNEDGSFPSKPQRQGVSGQARAKRQFTSDTNGQIEGGLKLRPPPSTLECPLGQTPALVSVTFTNVEVSEPNAGTKSIPGTFARTLFNI
jgi:hypothetical protein